MEKIYLNVPPKYPAGWYRWDNVLGLVPCDPPPEVAQSTTTEESNIS